VRQQNSETQRMVRKILEERERERG